jgi:putative nucleotidyltransferase with HDIG domain
MSEIISALSFALDLTEGTVPGHAIRSCLYGMRIAEELGLSGTERTSLYYALLLKDIGCSSNAARISEIVGSDDGTIKHDDKSLNWTRPSLEAISTLWQRALPYASPIDRARRVLRIGVDHQRRSRTMVELSCDRSANIARKIGLSQATEEAIRLLDEHWDGSGYPERRRGQSIPLFTRIMAIAQHIDIFASEQSLPIAIEELEARSGKWFDPALVSLVCDLYARGALQEAVGAFDHHARVREIRPDSGDDLEADDIDKICEAFADVVDAKSSFTYTHSVSVTRVAVGIAGELGFNEERCRLIRRASLLHDLGKLSVPHAILYKRGKLSSDEWEMVKGHAKLSEQILERISHFDVIAKIAGQHHERLDGSGYPHGLGADELSLDVRVVTMADVYCALAETRPYRPKIALDQVVAILRKNVPHKLDSDCFDALLRYLQSAPPQQP